MTTASTIYREMFHSVRDSYYAAHGHPPRIMQATHSFRRGLIEEMNAASLYMMACQQTGQASHLSTDEIEFCGVIIKPVLECLVPTLLAA